MKKDQNSNISNSNQPNIQQHSEFENFIAQGLRSGGCHCVASKSHGKSRLMFKMFESLQNQQDVRCIAFDGSETWLYCASKVPTFTIQERDIIAQEVKKTDDMEKYALKNWNLVKLALETNKNLLFRLKTRKPSKRGFFVRTIINHIDSQQRAEKEQSVSHDNKQAIAFFIEEAQDCFNNRSSARLDMEEFLTVFNEARNNKIAFFTASQRLTDFSKTIRSKQLPCIGKLAIEDITPFLRRLERSYSVNFAEMPNRTWFFNNSTFVSPEFKQSGKPYQINREIKERWIQNLPKPKSLGEQVKDWLKPSNLLGLVIGKQNLAKYEKIKAEAERKALAKYQQPTQQKRGQYYAQFDEEENEEMDDMFLLDPLGDC